MNSIVFRCDASLSIGSGHVMRCRTLARELQRRDAVVIFICRRQSGDLIDILEQEFSVLTLPEHPLIDGVGLAGRDLYGAWLGCSQAQDAVDCLQALGSADIAHPDWLVVDHYGLDINWERLILEGWTTKAPPKLLAIDDLADRSHESDLLLDSNYFGEATDRRYKALLPQKCTQLLGPHYALLGPEYAQLQPLLPQRSELRRVLVFFGGVDQDNLTGRTLEALMDPSLEYLAVDVVLGLNSPYRQAVADLVAQRPNTTLHDPLPSLAGLIARADLAIGASGSTTWERACLKLPSQVVAIAANQLPLAEALHQEGHLNLIDDKGSVSVEQIRSAFEAFIADPTHNNAGADLTDGFGAKRLALAMIGPLAAMHLRRANAGDEALLLRWANDPQVRAKSFSPSLITFLDHHNWFSQVVADSNRLLFIASVDGCPIGQIRFDRRQVAHQGDSFEAMISLSLDRCARGFGLAADLLRLGLQAMQQVWGPDVDAVAEVLTTNIASNACFIRAGFVQESMSSNSPPALAVNRWRFHHAHNSRE